MTDLFDAWKFVAGIGLFIYAMMLIEDAVKNLAGRSFKIFLKKQTGSPLRAVAGGTILTALLQSSSLVALMVLAFVGVGTISMQNAIAVILGSNLGTTLTGWIVAGLGFKLSIEDYTYPIIALSVLIMLLFKKRPKLFYTGMLLLGIAFLFMGIEFMKSGTIQIIDYFNLSKYAGKGTFFFLIVGFVLTSIIQSSAATMAIALSALSSSVILLPAAAAIVIGSEVGTTVKLLFVSINGSADKKRVAVGNIMYNIIMTIISFVLLTPILLLITDVFGIRDPLFALVSFQTLINFFGILLMLPFLKHYATLLIKLIREKEDTVVTTYINVENIGEAETALEALQMEAGLFVRYTVATNLSIFPENKITPQHTLFTGAKKIKEQFFKMNYDEKYVFLKNLHGELISFCIKLSNEKHNDEYSNKAAALQASVKYAMFSAKQLKDIAHNLENMRESAHDEKFDLYKTLAKEVASFFDRITENMEPFSAEKLQKLTALCEEIHTRTDAGIMELFSKKIPAFDITSMLNVNREVYNSFRQILHALENLSAGRENFSL
ncbi:MAG: Na/Pi cotransporter family protein [Bacteroidia bacterium]